MGLTKSQAKRNCKKNFVILTDQSSVVTVKLKHMFKKLPAALIALSLSLVLASSVFAAKPQGVATGSNRITQGSESGSIHACQARENNVKTRMAHLTQLAKMMQEKFDQHVMRVENYYTNKVLPSGKTVANYDSLVGDIQAKKALVQAALTTAQTDVTQFNCSQVNPKAQVTQFKQDMQAVKKALKNYRISIKNLIVSVHSVTGAQNREGTGSSKPGE